MKKIKLVFFQLIILFFALLLVELCLRIINSDMKNYDIEMWRYAKELKVQDSILGHIHLKEAASILQGVEVKLNSRGMRSEEFKKEDKKILFLGSSISLGWGVEQTYSYPQLIQEKIFSDSLEYKILNGSIGNYNTYRYINNFLTNYTDIKPEIIVVNYFINDVESLKNGKSNWFIKNLQLAATLNIALKKFLSKSGIDLKSYYKDLYDEDNLSFLEMKNALSKLSEYSSKTDTTILLTVIPDIHFLEDYPFEGIHEKMKSISKEFGFEFHDQLPSLIGIPFIDLQIIKGDSHPNTFGHSIIAETLYPEIKRIITNK